MLLADPWCVIVPIGLMWYASPTHLESVNAPPPLDHRQSGVGWSRKEFMSRRIENPVIFINHWRWLEANGYKRQAASCKRQAASLTRKNYNVIQSYKLKEKL
jgi:hypothetical protein